MNCEEQNEWLNGPRPQKYKKNRITLQKPLIIKTSKNFWEYVKNSKSGVLT